MCARKEYVSIYNASCVCMYVCDPSVWPFWLKIAHFGSNLPILAQICPFCLKFAHFGSNLPILAHILLILAQMCSFWLKFAHFGSNLPILA